MGNDLRKKEEELESLKVEDEIEEKRMSIAQKKAIEHEMKAKYGRNWGKLLGVVKKLRPNSEALHDLYSINPELKDLVYPGRRR